MKLRRNFFFFLFCLRKRSSVEPISLSHLFALISGRDVSLNQNKNVRISKMDKNQKCSKIENVRKLKRLKIENFKKSNEKVDN